MADTAIFDVDGTLVDTNYQHALAWFRAFRRYGITLPMWRIHRGIGMGGDMFVPEVAGREVEQAHGDDLRKAWVEEFDQLIGEIQPFEGAHGQVDVSPQVVQIGQRGAVGCGGFRPTWINAEQDLHRRAASLPQHSREEFGPWDRCGVVPAL